jgi:hypothetical protein
MDFQKLVERTRELLMARRMFRQGDLLFIEVEGVPKGRFERVHDNVIQRGEAGGHAHQLIGGKLYRGWTTEGNRRPYVMFIVIESVGKVVHEEHGEIVLEKGTWMVVRQREYSPQKGFEYVLE